MLQLRGKGHPARLCPKPRATFSLEDLHGEEPADDHKHEATGDTEGTWIGVIVDTPDSNQDSGWTLVQKKNKKQAKPQDEGQEIVSCTGSDDKTRWQLIKVPVDSGAADCVMPKDMLSHIPLEPSEKSKRKGTYTIANGDKILNHGQRAVRFRTDCGTSKG